jgi:hypothetical protein
VGPSNPTGIVGCSLRLDERRHLGPRKSGQKKAQEQVLSLESEFPGDVLLSHAVYREVPSGLKGLTAVFGMGTGVAPSLKPPGKPGLQRAAVAAHGLSPGATGSLFQESR